MRKIITLGIMLLFLGMTISSSMIPSALGDNIEPDSEDEWIYVRGVMSSWFRKGNSCHLYPIHFVVWYKTSEGPERRVYWFEFPEDFDVIWDSIYLPRMYEVALGLITYISIFNRGLEIIP